MIPPKAIRLIREHPPEPLRTDLIQAVNLLMERGQLPKHHYDFARDERGRWGVEVWDGSRYEPNGPVVWYEATEVIVGAGTRELKREFTLQ